MTQGSGDRNGINFEEMIQTAEFKILRLRREGVWQRLISGCTVSDEDILAVGMEPKLVRRCAELKACEPTPEEWNRFHEFIDGINYNHLIAQSRIL